MFNWLRKKIPVLTPHEGYERWAETYSTESNPIKDTSNHWVEQFLGDLNGKSVLDAGCGTGYFCTLAEKKGAAQITGVDFSEAMIEKAKANCKTSTLQCGDVANLSFAPDSFDVIICALVLAHVENSSAVISGFSKFMRKNGILILTDFHPYLTEQKSKRTFSDSKTKNVFEIKHFLHPLTEIQHQLKNSEFQILQLEEPQRNKVPIIYALKAIKE